MDRDNEDMVLGRQVPVAKQYSPQLLHSVPRQPGRDSLGVKAVELPFHGEDIWHAYELSWLGEGGCPAVYVGCLRIPASSPNLVESKSLKLYLNSLNNTRYASIEAARKTIVDDVSRVTGASVELAIHASDHSSFVGGTPAGLCIDGLPLRDLADGAPDAGLLELEAGGIREEALYSHLLRSLCPVTGQPDWATLSVKYRGRPIDRQALLRYIIAYRQHQEFHEQCVERIFMDIGAACKPEKLEVQAFYTRRGGLDISPWRSSEAGRAPALRLNRQ